MLHVNPTVGELQDEQLFADLMENLLDENVRVSELNIIKEEKSKERNIKAKALARDVENVKEELREFDDNSWSISIIKDYIEQLQDLRKRLNQIQSMEEAEVSFPSHMDTILDEDGGSITSSFTLQEWILYKKRNLLNRKDKLETANRELESKRKMFL